jgi:hypothetical protein
MNCQAEGYAGGKEMLQWFEVLQELVSQSNGIKMFLETSKSIGFKISKAYFSTCSGCFDLQLPIHSGPVL